MTFAYLHALDFFCQMTISYSSQRIYGPVYALIFCFPQSQGEIVSVYIVWLLHRHRGSATTELIATLLFLKGLCLLLTNYRFVCHVNDELYLYRVYRHMHPSYESIVQEKCY